MNGRYIGIGQTNPYRSIPTQVFLLGLNSKQSYILSWNF